MIAATQQTALRKLYTRASTLVDGFSEDLPPYDVIPHSLVEAEFAQSYRHNVDLFFRSMMRGTEPTEEDTAELVELALRRVRDGVPMDRVLANYRWCASMVWSQLLATASEAERSLLLEASLPLMQYLSLTTARIATACLERAHDPRWEQLERRRSIAQALLTGTDPGEWAYDSDTAVADGFLVAVVRLGNSTPSSIMELRARIDDVPGAFLRLDGGGATALIPLPREDDEATAIAKLGDRLPRTEGPTPPFWVGVTAARSRAEIPSAFAEARVLAEVGRCLCRPETLCRRGALLLEYTIAVSGSAHAGLATTLDPLVDHPVLMETLDVFVANDFNQLATARLLNVHRNTIGYRLTRIGELTGFDPQRPSEAMTLSAARTARLLTSASFAA